MKIASVEAVAVSIPQPQTFTSNHSHYRTTTNTIIEVHTDEGITGVGEASSVWDRLGRGERDKLERFRVN